MLVTPRAIPIALLVLALALAARAASAQPAGQPRRSVPDSTTADRQEVTNAQKNFHWIGHVELQLEKTSIFADEAWFDDDTSRFVAIGNIVFSEGSNRISAERAEFNTETGIGTFFTAWGMATVQPPKQTSRGGIAPPPLMGGDNIVYFFGEKIEKVGAKKYNITKGGFSTCVQPTPRWELTSDTLTLNVDHYTLLKNAILSVKGVPMLYLPVMYYPTKRDGRATGFLLPTYGVSALRGQHLHNAFFWAIDRSQDAEIVYDWFSKTGQGTGAEYRYNFGGGSDGNIRTYLLDQHEATYAGIDGATTTVAAKRDYEIRGSANQLLPFGIRARGRADYFSSILTSQSFNTNIYDSSRNQRTFGGNLVGAWNSYSMNATIDRSEYFYDATTSVLTGNWPRVTVTRNERPLLGTAAYFSVAAEYANFLRGGTNGGISTDTSLNRVDVVPQLRYPFKKWQWFTVNSTVSWRDTYYSKSLVGNNTSVLADEGVNRRFYSLQASMLGPVFNRVWDTPENGYAEKFKHTVEPFLTIQRTSPVDNFAQIPRFDGIDYILGGTSFTYGVNNRFYAKRSSAPGQQAQAREILSVTVTQRYNTNQDATKFDPRFASTTFNAAGVAEHFSPIQLTVRGTPSNDFNGTMSAEFDSLYRKLRSVTAQGSYSWTGRLQETLSWSKRALIPERPEFSDPARLDQSINSTTNVRSRDNRVGTIYAFNYDVLNSRVLNQRISTFYNAQCCGIAFEFQSYNYGANSSVPIQADHRFFLSFTLAGLGNFSPFNGALSGVPR